MKKYLILIIFVGVCWLTFSYRGALYRERGENLVTDAYYGDLISVKNDVEQGAPLGYQLTFTDPERNYYAQTFHALHAAASSGNGRVVEYLLQAGFDINLPTPQGWTPLFVAVRDGQANVAKWFIFKGADLNIQTDLGASALMMAVTQPFETEKARLDLLEYMLKRGAKTDLNDIYGHDAMYYAQAQGNSEVVLLLEKYSQPEK